MITPSFSLTATERVLPRMALDFTTAALDPRVTFTRTGNTATVVNSSGVVAPINADLPRFDYDPTTLVCKGFLIEEARTNILLYSDQLNNPSWVTTASSVTANAILSPDGAVSGDKLVEDSALASHFITTNNFTPVIATTYTFSAFVKAAERSFAFVGFNATSMPATFVSVNLSNGTIATATGTPVNSSITNAGNGWYRVSVSLAATAITAAKCEIRISTNGLWANRTYTGDGASGIYAWGAQIEAGAFPTSYIPTTTTTVTRNADVATMTGTNFSSWYNASEGSFASQFIKIANSGGRLFTISDGTAAEQIRISTSIAANIRPDWQIVDGGVSQVNITNATPVVAGTVGKVCGSYKVNNFNFASQGVLATPDTAGTIPTVTQLNFGANEIGAPSLNGWIQSLRYWPQALIAAEVTAFSK